MKYKIKAPDQEIYSLIKKTFDSKAKPIDGLGVFEELIARIGSIQGSARVALHKRCALIFIADNGIVAGDDLDPAPRVTQCGFDVTAKVAALLGRKKSTANVMAKTAGVDVIPVDVGIKCDSPIPGVRDCKIAAGTKNFLKEPAMSDKECERAIEAGIEMVKECKYKGYDIVAVGEMGIGNTTTAAALGAILLGLSAVDVTGRGAGLSDEGLENKKAVVTEAISKYGGGRAASAGAFEVLSCCGGFDIAAMCGAFIGAAMYGIPAVIDGAVSAVAALCAERIAPGAVEYMIPSHIGRESLCTEVLGNLGLWLLTPINGDMALGEATGAIMLFPLLDTALSLYSEGAAFAETEIESYRRC